jgi:hypothetical protein
MAKSRATSAVPSTTTAPTLAPWRYSGQRSSTQDWVPDLLRSPVTSRWNHATETDVWCNFADVLTLTVRVFKQVPEQGVHISKSWKVP